MRSIYSVLARSSGHPFLAYPFSSTYASLKIKNQIIYQGATEAPTKRAGPICALIKGYGIQKNLVIISLLLRLNFSLPIDLTVAYSDNANQKRFDDIQLSTASISLPRPSSPHLHLVLKTPSPHLYHVFTTRSQRILTTIRINYRPKPIHLDVAICIEDPDTKPVDHPIHQKMPEMRAKPSKTLVR